MLRFKLTTGHLWLIQTSTELQWFIVSEIVWAWKHSCITLHSHYKIVMERNNRFFFILWIGFVSEIYTNVVDSTDKLNYQK